MEDDDYPSTGILLEFLFGLFSGFIGIGHIFMGRFYEGLLILISYFVILSAECYCYYNLLPVKYTPLVLLWFFYIQNIIVASTSAQFLWKKKSKDIALILMGFIFGLTLLGFLYIEVSEKDLLLRLGNLFLLLCLLVLIIFFSFTSSQDKVKKQDPCIREVQKEIGRNPGATIAPHDKNDP
jgi:hypothetical protein